MSMSVGSVLLHVERQQGSVQYTFSRRQDMGDLSAPDTFVMDAILKCSVTISRNVRNMHVSTSGFNS